MHIYLPLSQKHKTIGEKPLYSAKANFLKLKVNMKE
jgi:hypothetical protein